MKVTLLHTNSQYLVGMRLPFLRALVSAGHEVTAMAPDLSARTARILVDAGVHPEEYSVAATGLNPLRDLIDLYRLWRRFRRDRPDVLVLNNAKPVALGSLAAKLARVPRCFALVGGLGYAFTDDGRPLSLKKRVARAALSGFYRIGFRLCDGVVFQNPDDVAQMTQWGICPPSKISVVRGSGVPLDRYQPSCSPPEGVTFVMISRLVAEKGVREFIEAARVVKGKLPFARFLLAGGFSDNPSALTKDEVDRIRGDGVVEILGQCGDIPSLLRGSSVFVLPSYREGVPRSTLEAMACGLPIVTTDAPGCRETVMEGENGFLVPVRNIEELAQAMTTLGSDSALRLRMGRRSRALAEDSFGIDFINIQLMDIFGIRGVAK